MFLQKPNAMQCVLSIIKFSKVDLLSVYVLQYSYVIHPRMLRNVQRQVSNFFLRILPEVVYKLNCVVARNASWFTMATLSDGIDSQMMLRIIRESKMEDTVKPLYSGHLFPADTWNGLVSYKSL